MKNIQLYNVAPSVPEKLAFLEDLAFNLWWTWHPEAYELFRRIDPATWSETRNPLKFFSELPHGHLDSLVDDDSFMSHYHQVQESYAKDLGVDKSGQVPPASKESTAYFSLEYGLHESVRLYSGGLGCLAGDHLKAASDLKTPLVAVGLLYKQGYFQQRLNADGWQQEYYPENAMHHFPVRQETDENGTPLKVSVPLPQGIMTADVWKLMVGRIPLYLLNTNIPENSDEFRGITAQLYGGDRLMRLRQELLLGIGGYRALIALGYEPPVCHINEGHAAFLSLARTHHLVQSKGLSLDVAVELLNRTDVFTTHTPVPAGNEVFDVDLVRPHLETLEPELGISPDQVLKWGRPAYDQASSQISMTILGLRTSAWSNGVSKLHGEVARHMWQFLWPDRPVDEVPIGSITNGVHVESWLAPTYISLFDRYLGADWRNRLDEPDVINAIDDIPDEQLWRTHELCRSRLISEARRRAVAQAQDRHASRHEVEQMKSVMRHYALTVGFARRFATYKRATLLLRDHERLEAMLTNKDYPIQFLFAGKAHPADEYGKALIRDLVHFARRANLQDKILFLENYDIGLARYLVQGVDIWLNNPRRPHEASGTSGMKAAINGALHVSTLDGWWDEAYEPDNGWAIGGREGFADEHYQDEVESQAFYNVLENEITRCFYDRTDADIPTRWLHMMKASMKMALAKFSSRRMVQEYIDLYYTPGQTTFKELCDVKGETLLKQHRRLEEHWGGVRLGLPSVDRDISTLHVGDTFTVTVLVQLGSLKPSEIDVQVYYGHVDDENKVSESSYHVMTPGEPGEDGTCMYSQTITCEHSGRYGFTARAVPKGPEWDRVMPGFIRWAEGL
jgi:starch phosphorylase